MKNREPRDMLVTEVRATKTKIVGLLDEGHRDWKELRAQVERYISFQQAADDLGDIDRARTPGIA